MGKTPEPTGRACQQRPRVVKASTASLTWVAKTWGASRSAAATGSSNRMTRLPVSSVTPATSPPKWSIIRQQFVHGQVGVRLQSDADAQIAKPGRQAAEDVERRGLLRVPSDVGPEPVVAVADVGAGVAAPQRGDGLDVERQVARVLLGRDVPVLPPRSEDRVGRGEADFEIEPQRVGPSAERPQALGIELAVDHFGVEELHALEAVLDGEVQQGLGRELAVADRVAVEADPHRHRRFLRRAIASNPRSAPRSFA